MFLHKVDEDDLKLVKCIVKTQMFHHFIEDAFEYEDNYEINLFNDCIALQKGLGSYAEEYIRDKLNPRNWMMQRVEVEMPNGVDLPANWEEETLMRDVDRFPKLDERFCAKRLGRMQVSRIPQEKTIVPPNMKALLKELKEAKEAKRAHE